MSRLATTIFAASLALALSTHAVSGERPHAARRTAELQYRLIEIPDFTPDGKQGNSAPLSINDRGQVLAFGTDETRGMNGLPGRHYFIWRRGQIVTELKSPDPAFPLLFASQINNRSEVVGSLVQTELGGGLPRGFVWRRGHFTVLGPLPSNGYSTRGAAINDWGEVAGGARDDTPEFFLQTAFRWFRGHFEQVPIAESDSAAAVDINNRGQVIGNTSPDSFNPLGPGSRGYVWNRKGPLRFLDSLPGAERMIPQAINDRSQIVGTAEFGNPNPRRAFLWEDGTVQDLGSLPGHTFSEALAINAFGTAVGWSGSPLIASTAMVWKDGQMRDLNDMVAVDDPLRSRVHLTIALDINNFGWIGAVGTDSSLAPLQGRGYLLIPVWKPRHR